jgi:predicted ester cyclase
MLTADEVRTESTAEERRNIELVREYMGIAYDPKRASAANVALLCAPNNRFIAPSTFREVHTLEQYAEDHGRIMRQVADLQLVRFDVFFAKGDRVCLRYTAEGSHCGEPHGAIPPTGRKARWTAAALFRVEDGKLVEFIKDWNKLSMWEQLGWPAEECLTRRKPAAVASLVSPGRVLCFALGLGAGAGLMSLLGTPGGRQRVGA